MTAREVLLYTRPGCHLCQEAHAVIEAARPNYGYAIREVDIDSDPALTEAYGVHIPVVVIDGIEVARHRISAKRWAHLLRRMDGDRRRR